jgi:3-hydroxyisobutyrate dehydrogenase-like beta-hydroxyacid dehydrogenase
MELGFIGIGRMGSRMAGRLLAAGHALAIYDVDRAACAPLAERGATLCDGPGDVAGRSDMILTSVPGPVEVEAVMAGPAGVIAGARPGALIAELSTIGPAQSQDLAGRATAAGLAYIDAPVSNGVPAAEAGELTIMVGGSAADYRRALPVLNLLGNRLYHLGPIGSGNIAKIANQVVYLAYVAAFSEVARLGRDCGLDVPSLVDVLRRSVAGAPLMTGWERRIETGDIEPGFRIRRVIKDLELGARICADRQFDAPVFQAALDTFRKADAAGFRESDMTAIYTRG